MNAIAIFTTLVQWLPTVQAFIQQAEQTAAALLASNGVTMTGEQKLQLVLGLVKPLYDSTNPVVPFEQISGMLTGFVTTFVALYHTLGVFAKKTA